MNRAQSWAFVIGVCVLMVLGYVFAVIVCPFIVVWQWATQSAKEVSK